MKKITSGTMKSLKKRHIKSIDLVDKSRINKFRAAFEHVLSSGKFILDKEVKSFEQQFAEYLGSKYCIGVGNGLEALQISLMSLGIGTDDEVITTPISAVATTLAIMAVGAKPVFVDTTEDGLINSDLIPQAITRKTKAILPVHLYGNSIDLEKIQAICKKFNLLLIEDAAQAHGSTFNGNKLGTFGSLGCFSFYPTKNLGALGDGGVIVTNSKALAQICREIRDYGQRKQYVHVRFGLNSRLDELQAALLNVKLSHLDKDNRKRQQLALRYIDNFSSLKEMKIIKPNPKTQSNFHLFVIKTKKRDQLMKYLQRNGIQTLIHYPTIIPDQPFLKSRYESLSLPVARSFVKTCLSLPFHPTMKLADVDFVSSKIINFYSNEFDRGRKFNEAAEKIFR